MASVRASTRVSIAWSGAAAFEDTDTLVLTVNGYSLDLRVFVSGPDTGTIDWSTVALVTQLDSSTPDTPVLRWDHLIDSRPPTDMEDQGSFQTLPNGDVVETGTMWNPKTDSYERYDETWRRFPSQSGAPYIVLERVDAVGLSKRGRAAKSFIGRVGSRALGLALDDDDQDRYLAWRDELRSSDTAHGDGWTRLYSFGIDSEADMLALPALPVDTPSSWVEGLKVRLGQGEWIIRALGTMP